MALTKIGTDGVKDDAVTSGKIPANAVGSSELADQSVTLAKLPHGDGSSDGKFLRANNGADPSFETVNTDLVADTSPQLGGQLDTNGNNVNFPDNNLLMLGTSNDLVVSHDGTNSYLDNNTGVLNVRSLGSGANVQIIADNDYMARFVNDGAVELYHDNSKKFETLSTGVRAQGGIAFGSDTAAANHLDDYEEGTFTPSNATIGVQSDYSYGFYQKVGDWVSVQLGVKFNNNSSSVDIYIEGLPFTPTADQYGQYANAFAIGYATGNHIQFAQSNGSGRIYLFTKNAGHQQSTHFDNDSVRLFGTYKVA